MLFLEYPVLRKGSEDEPMYIPDANLDACEIAGSRGVEGLVDEGSSSVYCGVSST